MKLIAIFLLLPCLGLAQSALQSPDLLIDDVVNTIHADVANSKYTLKAEDFRLIAPDLTEDQYQNIAGSMNLLHSKLYGYMEDLTNFPYRTILDTSTETEERKGKKQSYYKVFVKFRKEAKAYSIYNESDQAIMSFTFSTVNEELKLLSIDQLANDWNPASNGYYEKFYEAGKLVKARHPQVFDEYDNRFFQKWEYEFIPFRQDGKWGLKDYDGNTVYEAQADTIYPEMDNYRMVAVKGGKNLLDSNLKYYFAQPVKTILRGPRYFFSPTNDRSGTLKDYSEDFAWNQLPPRKPGVEYYRSLTHYVISNDSKTYKPVGIQNIRKIAPEDIKDDDDLMRISNAAMEHEPILRDKYKLESNKAEELIELEFTLTDNVTEKTIRTFTNWENLTHWHDYLVGSRNDSTYLMDFKGNVLFSTEHVAFPLSTHHYPEDDRIIYLFDRKTGMFGAYFPEVKLFVKPEYRSIKSDGERPDVIMVTTKEYDYGFIDSKGNKLF